MPQIVVLYMRSQLLKLIAIYFDGPLAQLAEHLTFNQVVRSSNLRWLTTMGPVGQSVKTSPFHGGVRSSTLLRVTIKSIYAGIAQLVEQRSCKP